MSDVYIIGVGLTHFKRWAKRDHLDLSREAISSALEDAQIEGGEQIDHIWFGNCGLHYWGQSNIRGQACLTPLMEEGLLPRGCPVVNVEGGCATGSLAFYGALGDVMSGRSDLSLALGVEKTFIAHDLTKIPELFASGTDRWREAECLSLYRSEAQRLGLSFDPSSKRIILLDISALHAQAHMSTYGVTLDQLAHVASKNHANGALNPKAQYQELMSPDEILADHQILPPFTRSMCAPISDGAAAMLIVSRERLQQLSSSIQSRAIPVLSSALGAGVMGRWDEEGPTKRAAQIAYQRAGITPQDVHIAELHDSTAYAEILHLEELGFCEVGQGGVYSQTGATTRTGQRPINTSGGLISKGHPLGASGVAMIAEVVTQLRQEAKERQAKPQGGLLKYGLVQNGGGLIGFQEAMSVVSILGAPQRR